MPGIATSAPGLVHTVAVHSRAKCPVYPHRKHHTLLLFRCW
ncbi:hypothetical protein PC116_g22650 [Phytophthora cactorum]|nr:hypothetical protein PC116_g22650 [Phytophthora cactorum]